MKIGILNECFFNKDTIKRLKQLGEVEINLDTDTKEKAIERIKDKDVIIADMFICPLTNDVLDKAPKLKLIAINSTAYHKLDLKYLNNRGIKLTNTPGFAKDSVAEQTFALIFAMARKTLLAANDFKKKTFEILPDVIEHRKYLGFNLIGKTLGVIGTGSIGGRVCEIGQALGMNVLGYNRSPSKIKGVKFKTFDEVISESDIISINTPLNDETRNLFNKKVFSKMKKHAIIVNTTSEEILNTDDLVNALQDKQIAGIAFDHLTIKDKTHPLLNMDNVLCLPMCGWYTQESLNNISNIITEAIEAFAKGKEKYTVKI